MMNKKLQNKLFKKYPIIFKEKDLPVSESCMGRGIETDDGWYKIIDELCSRLDWIRKNHNIEIIAKQVKEKFAGLRFYYQPNYPSSISSEDKKMWLSIIDGLIELAYNKSIHTCEKCSEYVEDIIVDHGWRYALCDKCYKKIKKTKKNV